MTDFLDRVSAIMTEGIEQAFGLEALVKILQSIKVDIDEEDEEIEEETACMRLAILLQTCVQNHDSPAFALVHDKLGDEENSLTPHLLDPGMVSESLLDECRGAIMMSGTLNHPQKYYDLLKVTKATNSKLKKYTSHYLTDRTPILSHSAPLFSNLILVIQFPLVV